MDAFAFTKSRFLLCEGDIDKGFLETLITERRLPDFQVCHAAECNETHTGGNSGFAPALKGFEPITGFAAVRALLIVTDNDKPSSFSDTQEALASNGYTPPSTPTDVGHMAGKPVAILMIPSADILGDLEKLCLPEIYRKWPKAEACVDEFMNCTGANLWTKQSSINKARARSAPVGFYEPDPYKGIGHLFRNGTLSTLNNCFDGVGEFLRRFDAMVGI